MRSYTYEVTLIGPSLPDLKQCGRALELTQVGSTDGLRTQVLIGTMSHTGNGRSAAIAIGEIIETVEPSTPVTYSVRRSPGS